ncbi:MAG: serine/threonine-protein kinase [Kofleriaceae bacterium]
MSAVPWVADASAYMRPKQRRARKPRPANLSAGQRVGPWRVQDELGRGGMAAVYAVSHSAFGKRAALKLAHREVLCPEFDAQTFLREARIVHLVDHPGVCDVFATGTFDGRPYLAMERLRGETLGQLVDANRLSRGDAIGILLQLCDVLAAAHRAGVVHRDLKLDNVFVQPCGNVKLLDWGVACVVSEPDPMHGMIAGTLTYMAPEQVACTPLTPAADIYSLGVLAYHLLLGGPPFTADTDLELIKKHVSEPPPAPATLWPEIPAELAAMLVAMLAKDPASRPSLETVKQTLSRRLSKPRKASRLASAAFASAIALIGAIAAITA